MARLPWYASTYQCVLTISANISALRESGSRDETCQAASFVGLPMGLRKSRPHLSYFPDFRVCQTSLHVRTTVRAPGNPATQRPGPGFVASVSPRAWTTIALHHFEVSRRGP